MAVMRRMEQMLHRCHPRDLIKKVVQEWGCPFVLFQPPFLPLFLFDSAASLG